MRKQVFSTVVRGTKDMPSITISTASVDRDGDVLAPEGAILGPYQRNPVILYGHDHHSLPVGSTTAITVAPGVGLTASFRWLENDPFADRVKNAFAQGVLRAASVGFIPHTGVPLPSGRGTHYTSWELIEWSLVNVPANSEAVRTLKRLGLATPDDAIVLELADDPPFSRAKGGGRVVPTAHEAHVRNIKAGSERITKTCNSMLASMASDDGDGDGDDDGKSAVVLELSDTPRPASIDVDPRTLSSAIADTSAELAVQLRATLPDVVRREVSKAINRLRGRVD